MKDIEKIKSEQVAAQVADANPGNFAIEQEVAQLVGATVPAPTEPSADDARELGAQLLVFLRRALTPIQSALRTALAAIYAHLDSRCTDYPCAAYAPYIPRPYDPMTTPRVPRTLPNLLTALTAFSHRKISNGSATADGIPDGVSLAHILGDSSVQVTKIVDDNTGWTMDKMPNWALFPYATDWSFGCTDIDVSVLTNNQTIETLRFPALEIYKSTADGQPAYYINSLAYTSAVSYLEFPKLREVWELCTAGGEPFGNLPNLEVLSLPNLEFLYMGHGGGLIRFSNGNCSLREVLLPKLQEVQHTTDNGAIIKNRDGAPDNIVTKRLVVGTLKAGTNIDLADSLFKGLEDIEVGDGTCVSFKISAQCTYAIENNLTTFLQNFLEHICQRLANRTGQTKLTLTLSADVYTAIMTDNDIKAELVARNWKVTDGTNNYNN